MIENNAGTLQQRMATVQAAVIPITDKQLDYARGVLADLKAAGVRGELDERSEKVGYKIRDWELKKVPFMLVVGESERQSGTVAVRLHRQGDTGAVPVREFIDRVTGLVTSKALTL